MKRETLRSVWATLGASLLVGLLGGFAVAALAPLWNAAPDLPAEARFRMLAVGDTGHPPKRFAWWDPQLAVASAMTASDRLQPADVFVLLGDNFYPDGLLEAELEERIAGNLVAPYCRFLDLAGPEAAAVADACPLEPRERRPIPVRGVLGNHDYRSEASPDLQAEAVPRYVANWRLEAGAAFVEEHPAGVSVVYFDSTPGRLRARVHQLGDALRETRGPWRIVVAHHPIEVAGKGEVLRAELARSGVPVHLWIAGHEHNLQISVPGLPGPALQVIAGSGSHATRLKYEIPGRRFFRQQVGFARVDLVATGPGAPHAEELQVALVATRTRPFQVWRRARVVARWAVAPDGELRRIEQVGSDPLRYERKDVSDEAFQ